MNRRYSTALLGLLVFGATACSDFLNGGDAGEDPNNALTLTDPRPLYLALQTSQAIQFEGQLARTAAMYTQQAAGVARQAQGYDIYLSQPTDVDPYWQGVWIGGGLKDARRIQQLAQAQGDSTTAGIAKVWEALIVGTAASIWGDLPYRGSLQFSEDADPTTIKPTFDQQSQVYADVQAKLDTAITFLARSGATNVGPRGAELIYAGRSAAGLRAVYSEVAHTLKARFYLHMAEVDASNYNRAATQARLGISSTANDFNTFHSSASTTENIHYQYYGARGDVLPGAAIVNLMKARIASGLDSDTDRMAFYFWDICYEGTEDPSRYFGLRPAGNPNVAGGGGAPAGTTCDGDDAEGFTSDFNFINPFVTGLPDFRQPVITFAETKFILAEACLRGATCGATEALDAMNAQRSNEVYGATDQGPVTFRDQRPLLLSEVTLQNVMEEKYIDLYLNIEVWNDYKRTCLPRLAPATTSIRGTTQYPEIPGRIPYGLSEFNTNAANVPTASATGRNDNDPNACPLLTFAQAY